MKAKNHDYPPSLQSAMISCIVSSCRSAIGEGGENESSGSEMEQRHNFLHNRDK